MQLLGDKTKHLAHVLPVSLLADDALGALQIGGCYRFNRSIPYAKTF
jgi:hypothetical protein